MNYEIIEYSIDKSDLYFIEELLQNGYTLTLNFYEFKFSELFSNDNDSSEISSKQNNFISPKVTIEENENGKYIIIGHSHTNLPERFGKIKDILSLAKINEMISSVKTITTLEPPYQTITNKFKRTVIGIDWINLIKHLKCVSKVKCETNEHEYSDNGSIIWVDGFDLINKEPVDALGHGNESMKKLEQHLVNMITIVPKSIPKTLKSLELINPEDIIKSIREKIEKSIVIDKNLEYELLKYELLLKNGLKNPYHVIFPMKEKDFTNFFYHLLWAETKGYSSISFPIEIDLNNQNKFDVHTFYEFFDEITVELTIDEILVEAEFKTSFTFPKNKGIFEYNLENPPDRYQTYKTISKEFTIKKICFNPLDNVQKFSFYEQPISIHGNPFQNFYIQFKIYNESEIFNLNNPRKIYLRSYLLNNDKRKIFHNKILGIDNLNSSEWKYLRYS